MMSRKDKIVRKLVAAVEHKMKHNKVEVVKAKASILENNKGIITLQAEDKTYECRNLLICTGSETAVPPIKGLADTPFLTSREVLTMTQIPDFPGGHRRRSDRARICQPVQLAGHKGDGHRNDE